MRGFLIDLHCHTREHSHDGRHPAVELVGGLAARGFDGCVLTDHNYAWPEAELAELRHAARLPESFVLLSGQEVRTAFEEITWGDLLVFGPVEGIADGASPFDVMNAAHAAGGFCIAAHPGLPRIGLGAHIRDLPLAGVEVWNGRYGPEAQRLTLALPGVGGFPHTGGSDAHQAHEIGGGGTLLVERATTLGALGAQIAAGQCRPWRPTLLGRLLRGR